MDSKEKMSSSDIADDLDLEPLNLDFELPPIEDSDLVGLESGSDFGDLATLDLPEGELGSSDFAYNAEESNLDESDFTVSPQDGSGLDSDLFTTDDAEEPVTLTADELSDIVGADLEMDTELSGFGADETDLGSMPVMGDDIELSAMPEMGDDIELGAMPEMGDDMELGAMPEMGDDMELGAMPEMGDDIELGTMPDISDESSYGELEELDLEMPEDSIASDELVLPDDLDMDLSDLSGQEFAADTAEIESALPDLEGSFDFEPPADLAEDLSVNLSEADDEDVALSEDELDNILGDVDQGLMDHGEDDHVMRDEMAHDMEDVDPLEFSDEELQREVLGDEVQMPQLSILDSDDDESITLTADELSNIVSDDLAISPSPFGTDEEVLTDDIEEMEAVQEFEGFSDAQAAETESSIGSDLEEPAQPSFFQEEEEGPVALTDDELADILEGTALEGTVLDQGVEAEPEVALQEEPRADRMADELSLETGVKREELKKVIGYLDDLLGQLPEETVREFSRSEYFNLYKKVIEELGVFK